eukprot:jgi/Bigna1/39680/e_gw1.34.20.1
MCENASLNSHRQFFNLVEEAKVSTPVETPITKRSGVVKRRLASLDAFRGLTVIWMILVDEAGDAYHNWMDHSPWNGIRLADFVFPFFLYISGVSVALSLRKPAQSGDTRLKLRTTWKVCVRAFKLFLLGLIMQGGGFPNNYDLLKIRIPGILQRIAICFLIVALIELWIAEDAGGYCSYCTDIRLIHSPYLYQWIVFIVLNALYLGLLFGVRPAGCGSGGYFTPQCNSASLIDEKLFGLNHMYKEPTYIRSKECSSCSPAECPIENAPQWCEKPFDPEGMLGTLCGACSGFLGLQIGHILQANRYHHTPPEKILSHLMGSMLSMVVLGVVAIGAGMPLNKNLYTSSYMLVTAAVATFFLMTFYASLDVASIQNSMGDRVHGIVLALVSPLLWVGRNAIFIFVFAACDVLADIISWVHTGSKENNLVHWFRVNLLQDGLGFSGGILLYTWIKIVFWVCVAFGLDYKGIYYKI